MTLSQDLDVITAGIPHVDDCPVLTRIKAFLVPQGLTAILEHVFRQRDGLPADLSGYLAQSDSLSSAGAEQGTVKLRVKEVMARGVNVRHNPIWEVPASVHHLEGSVLRSARLPAALVEHTGIYVLSWGVFDTEQRLVAVNEGLLSVERSLFPQDVRTIQRDLGPMTINEIRLELIDSSAAENLIVDSGLEFGDEQIVAAITKPIEYYNETPPPLQHQHTTRDFPHRGSWRRATIAQLLLAAAHNYRRNFLQYQAGGVALNDKAKEKDYLAAGNAMWQEYKEWVTNAKLAENIKSVFGITHSAYVRRG